MHTPSTLVLSFFTLVICSGLASAACPALYTEIAGGCFLVVETNVDFHTARDICQSYNGDFAVVSDCHLLGSLSEYLQTHYADNSVWVGASDLASEGQWHWIDGTLVEFGAPYWARIKPEDFSPEPQGGTYQNCANMYVGAGYYFQDNECDLSTGYAPLCETPPNPITGSCPGSYEDVGDSKCFQFLSTVDATWDNARVICQATGGDLAIINDCQLMKSVIDFAQQTGAVPETGFWIGGSDDASEGTWRWVDGSRMDMSPTFWGRTYSGYLEPDNYNDQDCLILWSEDRFLFNDAPCDGKYFPLCQVEPIEEK